MPVWMYLLLNSEKLAASSEAAKESNSEGRVTARLPPGAGPTRLEPS